MTLFLILLSIFSLLRGANTLNIVVAGGTGRLGRVLISSLLESSSGKVENSVTCLSRNTFLASAPNRVSVDFGFLGKRFVSKYTNNLVMRDWDGGDLLDIVGQDWVGWEECLEKCDVVVNLVGGFTVQREQAQQRLTDAIRNSEKKNNRVIKQIIVAPDTTETIKTLSPVAISLKEKRLAKCEEIASIGKDVNILKIGLVVPDAQLAGGGGKYFSASEFSDLVLKEI
ncbi:hypothetical protein TrLO_g13653 [Triparma laevis f. longispina]|uniref:NAD(P)-binding domain-containing protein n=1 Tax=Triparma laevis f. longispina TaxID=1714387 RepID=A0A9W7DZM1_9STRA|nr:hypothetical protein TrLO_g13653 [Triparma laevis f. longispina]